jgi:hypothetical protein
MGEEVTYDIECWTPLAIGVAQALVRREVGATRLMPPIPNTPVSSTEATLRDLQIRWMDAWGLATAT